MKTKYVLGFLFDDDKERVLLILKDHPDWQKGRFNGIGGIIEKGEEPGDAMHREAIEEASVDDVEWHEYQIIRTDDYELYCFKAFDTASLEAAETTAREVVTWAWIDNLPRCVSYTRDYLDAALGRKEW